MRVVCDTVGAKARPPRHMANLRILRYVFLGLLLLVALYELYQHINDLTEVYQLRHSFNSWWIIVAALAEVSQYGADGYVTRALLRIIKLDIDVADAIRVASLDIFASSLFPVGQFGWLAASFYFYRRLGLDSEGILFFNTLLALITVIFLLVAFLLSLAGIPGGTFPFPLHFYLLAAIGIVLLILLALAIATSKVSLLRMAVQRILRRAHWYGLVEDFLARWQTYRTLLSGHEAKFVGLVAIKSVAYYGLEFIALESCFLAFHTFPAPPLVIAAYIISLVAGYLSFIPGGLGSADASLAVMFLYARVNAAVVLGVILLYRFVSVILPLPLGALAYFSLKRELKDAVNQSE